MVFHTNFTVMIHTVAIWLTLSLAIWRFVIMIKLISSRNSQYFYYYVSPSTRLSRIRLGAFGQNTPRVLRPVYTL